MNCGRPRGARAAVPGLLGRWPAGLAALLAAAGCQAGATRYCDEAAALSATQHDRLLRFGGIVKAELERSGASVAIVARSGLDLARFGLRYSHAGLSLKAGTDTPWAVRQLYFACDERRPRLYDQGMAAFVLGMNEPALGYVSVLLLPKPQDAELARTALDKAQALALLGASYSANAYPYSLKYQNCNQWLVEMLASAWGGSAGTETTRAGAQAWLKNETYEASVIDVGWRVLMWLGAFIPWVHSDDHPAEDTARQIYRVSMPAAIDAFVQRKAPGATRLEFCHTETQVVVRRGWEPIAEGCVAGEHDTVVALD